MALLNISEPRSRQRPAAKGVGIELGTTHSVVALVKDGRAIALADDDGQILQPSVVRYLPSGEAVVGAAAAAAAVTDADNTISSVKSYMGCGYDDFDRSTRGFVATLQKNDSEAGKGHFFAMQFARHLQSAIKNPGR